MYYIVSVLSSFRINLCDLSEVLLCYRLIVLCLGKPLFSDKFEALFDLIRSFNLHFCLLPEMLPLLTYQRY